MAAGALTGLFSPALGKGPYQLSSVAAGGALVVKKAVGNGVALVKAEEVAPGDISSFLLTAALYKAAAHGKHQPWPGGLFWEGGRCRRRRGFEALSQLCA